MGTRSTRLWTFQSRRRHRRAGNVTETRSDRVAPGGVGFRHGSALLPPTSLPAADHPARDLAVSPVHTELPGRGGATAGPGFARRLRRSRPRLTPLRSPYTRVSVRPYRHTPSNANRPSGGSVQGARP